MDYIRIDPGTSVSMVQLSLKRQILSFLVFTNHLIRLFLIR